MEGRPIAHLGVLATAAGHLWALDCSNRFDGRTWAIEDCRHRSRCLEADLGRAGESVLRVPLMLRGPARRAGRDRGKSDAIDALAAARAALRADRLPLALLAGGTREVRLLLDHGADLVNQNRPGWHLHELGVGAEIAQGTLNRFCVLHRRELVAPIEADARRINELEHTITERVRPLVGHLLALPGCGALSAAKILGEPADVTRFRSKATFARHNGTAPDPGLVGQPRPPPAESRWQPFDQPRLAPHRGDPAACWARTCRPRAPMELATPKPKPSAPCVGSSSMLEHRLVGRRLASLPRLDKGAFDGTRR